MNRRQAKIVALKIVRNMIWQEVSSPTGLTSIEEGMGLAAYFGVKTREDHQEMMYAIDDIDLLLDKLLQDLGEI